MVVSSGANVEDSSHRKSLEDSSNAVIEHAAVLCRVILSTTVVGVESDFRCFDVPSTRRLEYLRRHWSSRNRTVSIQAVAEFVIGVVPFIDRCFLTSADESKP